MRVVTAVLSGAAQRLHAPQSSVELLVLARSRGGVGKQLTSVFLGLALQRLDDAKHVQRQLAELDLK